MFQESQTALCDTKQSPQQLMYNLYNSIALAEMKGYAMLQFSYNILRLHKKSEFSNRSQFQVSQLRFKRS